MEEVSSVVGFIPCVVEIKDAKLGDCFLMQPTLHVGDLLPRCCSVLLSHLSPTLGSFHFLAVLWVIVEENVLPRYHSCWIPRQSSYNCNMSRQCCVCPVSEQTNGRFPEEIHDAEVQGDRTVGSSAGIWKVTLADNFFSGKHLRHSQKDSAAGLKQPSLTCLIARMPTERGLPFPIASTK